MTSLINYLSLVFTSCIDASIIDENVFPICIKGETYLMSVWHCDEPMLKKVYKSER